jgi:glycosyltransferase involved in cell wall biosynthesis
MIRITYIISHIDQAPFFEKFLRMLDKSKFDVSVLLLNPGESKLEEFIVREGINFRSIKYRGKRDYIKALYKCYRFLKKNRTKIVHAHLIDAGLLGLFAAFLAGIKLRVYTRHGGSQRVYFPKGAKHDKAINRLATHIIATCENVKEILTGEEKVLPSKITVINLAFNIAELLYPDQNSVEELQVKYNPQNKKPVIGVISRWVEWKGIQFIIPAFKKVLESYPDALLVLANTNGNYSAEIRKQLSDVNPENICLITFERKYCELYQLFDVFVHVPVGKRFEAFGQIYVEALSAGIASVFTKAGIADEIIEDDYNAIVVDFENSEQILAGIIRILGDPVLKNKLVKNGKESIRDKFTFDSHMQKQERFYLDIYNSMYYEETH